MTRPETSVPALLVNKAQETPDNVALLHKVLGKWDTLTWADYLDRTRAAAAGFRELGVAAGDAVVIIAENTPMWLFADLGIQANGGFTVGLFATTPGPEVAYILADCKAKIVVVGDQEQADKVLDIMEEHPELEISSIVYIDETGVGQYEEEFLVSFDDLVDRGHSILEGDPGLFDRLLDERDLDETALVGYTSGTTGLPKGVMITHRNMVEVTKSFEKAFPMDESDRIVAWVAVAHPAIRGPQVYTPYRNGARLAFPESADTFQEALHEIAPTYIMCPPRYLEVMSADVRVRMSKSTRIKRLMYRLGMKLGERAAERKWARGDDDLVGRILRLSSWVLVGKGVLEKLGLDKIRWPLAGGAAVSAQLLRFFHSLGFELRQVYGQAETCGVPFAQYAPGAVTPGTVGTVLPDTEATVNDDGELLVRGPGIFRGYLGKPEVTAEVLDSDGWFNTGDLAEFTEAGELVLLDRESSIMRTLEGVSIAPTEVENGLKFSPYVSEAVLIANGKPFPTALIQIEMGTVSDWAQNAGLPYTTFRSLTELEAVQGLIRAEIDGINHTLDSDQQVLDFRLLPKELDVDDDELTPTRKVKRRVIDQKFGDLIAEMYESTPSNA